MTRWKRLFYYLILNVLVSACTVWTVLSVWEWRNPEFSGVLPAISLTRTTASPEVQKTTLEANSTQEEVTLASTVTADETQEASNPVAVNPETESSQVSISNIFGMGVLDTERVRIIYSGGEQISLFGWKLQDDNGHEFAFPELTLFSKGTVEIHTAAGTDNVNTLYWGLDEPIWETGVRAVLLDSEGDVRNTYLVP